MEDYIKNDSLTKKLKIAALAVILIAVSLFVIIKHDSLIPGWHGEGEDRYYIVSPLKRAEGIVKIDGKDYFFSQIGNNLLYGWNKLDGYYYYSDGNGVIVKGEATVDGERYSFDAASGKLYDNRLEIIGGKLWYFNDHGFKVFGIVELDGEKFCFSENGNLKKGLQIIDGKTYYFDPEFEFMRYGFISVGGATYYFGEDGAALVGEQIIDGEAYIFGEDGKLINR